MRTGTASRKSTETQISVKINVDGRGEAKIDTGLGFFDHMLELFTFHGKFNLDLTCKGDLYIDGHHSVEDTGIVMGQALKEAIGQGGAIKRYATQIIPMDEALIMVSIDISGRPYLHLETPALSPSVGDFDTQLLEEFLRAFANHLGITLHVKVIHGKNTHHIIEGIFKALGRALNDATLSNVDGSIQSTKGLID